MSADAANGNGSSGANEGAGEGSDAAKSLPAKLERIRSGRYSGGDFVIADAKDGDMAFGITSPGPDGHGGWLPRAHHLESIRQMTRSGLIDIMLMSVSTGERLVGESLFEGTAVTPAVRLNDTTDIWCARGSRYRESASRPFASADPETASALCDLGLYSMTFHDDIDVDHANLAAYRDFRLACREHPIRHFLEVFNPAFDIGLSGEELGHYVNDMIVKATAGLVERDRPLFLKLQFNGPKSMRELAGYDPENLIVGILGGSKGTTRDTFELISQAEEAGARVALFGRKINLAEAPLELVRLMRETIEERLTPEAAVREYHHYLEAHRIEPERDLAADLEVTEPALRSGT